MLNATPASTLTAPRDSSLGALLRWAVAHPYELFVRRWNYKSALFSALFRGAIFFTVNSPAGRRAAAGAMLAEFVWRSLTSGAWGALTQQLTLVRPRWHAIFGTMVLLPAIAHSIEFVIHYLRGTPYLGKSILVSVCFTQISDLFNLYVMTQGAMLVGAGARPLAEDMRRIPALIAGFLLVIPRAILAAFRSPGPTSAL